jgi:ABC-type multidrug transport system ATPase subunit
VKDDRSAMIIASNLTKRYGKTTALDSVSFQIDAGESVALWGANGAGKTTTIRCLLGVHGFDGQLTIAELDTSRHGKAVRALIGYVPQEARFYDLSVRDALQFYARLKKVDLDRVNALLTQMNLDEHAHKRVSMLSGGMKQRLALAAALLADPPILLLDEPTANLDVQAQRDFIQAIQALNHAGKTVIFCSHRLEDVMALATRVLVLAEGKLTLECLPHALPEALGMYQWLRLWISAGFKEPTLQVLNDHGFVYVPNGRSVVVQVNEKGKIAPLAALQTANIPVDDFDLVDGDLVATLGEHHD